MAISGGGGLEQGMKVNKQESAIIWGGLEKVPRWISIRGLL